MKREKWRNAIRYYHKLISHGGIVLSLTFSYYHYRINEYTNLLYLPLSFPGTAKIRHLQVGVVSENRLIGYDRAYSEQLGHRRPGRSRAW